MEFWLHCGNDVIDAHVEKLWIMLRLTHNFTTIAWITPKTELPTIT
jgi:hypothetical protein